MNTGGPAFPGFDYIDQYGKKNPEGMTLRDYFAANVTQALIASRHTDYENGWYDDERVAESAYKMADAMLKAREQ